MSAEGEAPVQWVFELPPPIAYVVETPSIPTALQVISLYEDLKTCGNGSKLYAGTKTRATFNVRPHKDRLIKTVKHFIHRASLNSVNATATAIEMDLANECFDVIEKRLLAILKKRIKLASLCTEGFLAVVAKI